MSWFGAEERGLALGIRQTSTPLGIAIAALALPAIERAGGLEAAFSFGAGLVLVMAVVGGIVVRDVPGQSEVSEAPKVLRDARLWVIGVAGGLYLVAQIAVTGFLVLFFHDERGFSTQEAALVLAVIQVFAVALRIGLGRLSDVRQNRIGLLRLVGLAGFASLALTAVVLDASDAVVVAAFVLSGMLTMSWNGLSFTAAAELAGRGRSGAAIGFQQTILSFVGAAAPPAFAAVVDASSWRFAFALGAVFPLAGALLLAARS
jgi:sugar phosphate permease